MRKSRVLRATALAAAAAALALPRSAGADAARATAPPTVAYGIGDALGLSPFWHWKTIETEHFRVSYPEELQDVANKTANYLEDANATMSPLLQWQPHLRTQVLVIDNADAANGLTAATFRLGMVLYVTPPESWFSTAYYDDWLRLLCFHEYTHFLNMDAATDFWKLLRYAFGDVILPNAYWPPWMLEGLAVYMETRFTGGGRGRSPYYEMLLRAAVAERNLDEPSFITLDKVNGPNPYFPAGETPYLFGYELMNEVAHEPFPKDGMASDRDSVLKEGPQASPMETALGEMSIRSAHRVPYFINDNLENITGKDWYQFWSQWVDETRKRASEELARIRTQPVTPVKRITEDGLEVLGSAVSPDGKWMAWTEESLDEHQGLYVRNLRTGETSRIEDKTFGANLAFTSDSRTVIYSTLRKRAEYYLFSDLRAYDVEDGRKTWLTDSARAKDPDVSRDGAWVAFTVTQKATTGVAIAPVGYFNNQPKLGETKILYMPDEYSRAAQPRFSADGRRVYFSLHVNGRSSEEIAEVERDTGKVTILVDNGHYNRYAAVNPAGDLYYVSDASGADNLYRYTGQGPLRGEMVTNLETGMYLPSFGPDGALYASVFSTQGSNLARLELAKSPVPVDAVRVGTAPVPAEDASSKPKPADREYPSKDYSSWPSILPRQWAVWPFPTIFYPGGVYLAGEVAGFDAAGYHTYIGGLGYNTQIPKLDWIALYSNRSLGATITLDTEDYVNGFDTINGTVADYTRQIRHAVSVSYPFLWTYSSLTPSINFDLERAFFYVPGAGSSSFDVFSKSAYVPTLDGVLLYTSALGSSLAISPEEGRTTLAGARVYLDSGQEYWKGLFSDSEYLRVTRHSVLVPSVKAMYVSAIDTSYATANAAAEGYTAAVGSSLTTQPAITNFDRILIHGYPNYIYYRKGVATGALDYRFPIAYVYRGWGTNPFFFEKVWGSAFAEATALAPVFNLPWAGLPAAGAAVNALVDIFQVPIVISAQYNYGFRTDYGGMGEFIGQLGVGTIRF